MGESTTVTVETPEPEAQPEVPTTVVVPIVTSAPPTETVQPLLELVEKTTNMETLISSLQASVAELSVRVDRVVHDIEAEPEVPLVEVIPEPIPEPKNQEPPKKERHPILALLLGKSPTKV